jgi:hypothetical protein
MLAILFFAAFVVARGVEPSILGWRAGIQRLIERIELTSAVLGQLSVAAGSLLALQLLISTLIESNLNVFYRIAIAPLSAGIVTLVMASATKPLPLPLVVALAALSGMMALAATVPTLLADHTRATGLVLGIAGTVALLGVLMRTLALYASIAALAGLFRATQWLATGVLLVELAACVIAGIWLAKRRWTGAAIVGGVLVVTALVWTWISLHAALSGSGFDILASKSLNALARNPRPLGSPFVILAQVALILLCAPVAAFLRHDRPYARSAIAFALLTFGGTDIPVLALGLTIAALLAPLAAAREKPSLPAPRSIKPADLARTMKSTPDAPSD